MTARETPIICPNCERDTGYTEEQFMHCVVDGDIRCPHCQHIIIKSRGVDWNNVPEVIQPNELKITHQKIITGEIDYD